MCICAFFKHSNDLSYSPKHFPFILIISANKKNIYQSEDLWNMNTNIQYIKSFHLFDIKQFIICINKMDIINFNQKIYNKLKQQIYKLSL